MSRGMLLWQVAFACQLLSPFYGAALAAEYSERLIPVGLVGGFYLMRGLTVLANTLISDIWFDGDDDEFEYKMENLYREFWGITGRK